VEVPSQREKILSELEVRLGRGDGFLRFQRFQIGQGGRPGDLFPGKFFLELGDPDTRTPCLIQPDGAHVENLLDQLKPGVKNVVRTNQWIESQASKRGEPFRGQVLFENAGLLDASQNLGQKLGRRLKRLAAGFVRLGGGQLSRQIVLDGPVDGLRQAERQRARGKNRVPFRGLGQNP
jgi:hypothetical protein